MSEWTISYSEGYYVIFVKSRSLFLASYCFIPVSTWSQRDKKGIWTTLFLLLTPDFFLNCLVLVAGKVALYQFLLKAELHMPLSHSLATGSGVVLVISRELLCLSAHLGLYSPGNATNQLLHRKQILEGDHSISPQLQPWISSPQGMFQMTQIYMVPK